MRLNSVFCILVSCWISNAGFAAENMSVLEVPAARPGAHLETTLGLGISNLALSIDSPRSYIQYDANNLSYYSLGLSFQDYGVSVRIPNPDSSPQSRLQSTVTDYQVGFPITSQLRGHVFYQDYKGYYAETTSKAPGYNANRIAVKPSLQSRQLGGQITYVTNPDYAMTMSESSSWSQERDAGSTIISLGYNQFSLIGNVFSEVNEEQEMKWLRRLDINVLAFRVGRGYNWLWQHWFIGSQIAVGVSFNQIKMQYDDNDEYGTDFGPTGCIGLSGGYRWATSKLGLFSRAMSWQAHFGNSQELSSYSMMSGIYWSMLF